MDYLIFFIVAVLHSSKFSGEGRIVDSTVKLANNMILKCVCPKNGTISLISWSKKKGSNKDNIAVFKPPQDLHIGRKYKDRVHIVTQTPNNKSLVFRNTTEADLGYYHCSFTIFPHGIWEKKIHVVQSGDFEPPIILPSFHVVTILGRVNLTCRCDPEVAVSQVIWEKVQVDSVDLVVQCGESGPPICGAEYEERVEIDCANRANSTMILGNVTASDLGIYRCRYIGANGENTTGWVKLIVNDTGPLEYDQTIFFIAGGAVAVTVLLIIILAIVVSVHHRRKKKRKRFMMAKHVAQRQDSNRYGRSGLQARWNASGVTEENADTFATMQDAVYVNYRVCSHKPNMGL